MKILIIVAHPDDETIGCSGTLSKFYNDEKMLITMTDGESSRNIYNKNRNLDCMNICKLLNINTFIYGNFPDNKLDSIPLLDIVKFIELKCIDFKPDLIFTHHPDCLNIDHSIVYRAVITAFRPQHGLKFDIYSFYIPSSTDYNPLNNFKGNCYIQLEDKDIELKTKCLKIYDLEMKPYPHSRSVENIINLNKIWGAEIGYKYCEKFQIIRKIL